MSEQNLVPIERAQKAVKDRGGAISFAEQLAKDIVSGKVTATDKDRSRSIEYLFKLDMSRKQQRFAAVNDRRKKNKETAETPTTESQITPELAKRLAKMGES